MNDMCLYTYIPIYLVYNAPVIQPLQHFNSASTHPAPKPRACNANQVLILSCCSLAWRYPLPVVDKQRTIPTVTNNNRCAERERIKAHEAALVERSLDLGLVAPDKQAADDERGAYAAILVKDKEVVAWLLKQRAVDGKRQKIDFYCAFKTPYVKARQFPAKARAG